MLHIIRRWDAREVEVLLRDMVSKEPAHSIGTNPFGGIIEDNHIAFRFMHRRTILGHQSCIAEECFERRRIFQHRTHDQHRVEPVFELAWERLGHEVSREPLLPVSRIGAIVQRRIRHNASIEPRDSQHL